MISLPASAHCCAVLLLALVGCTESARDSRHDSPADLSPADLGSTDAVPGDIGLPDAASDASPGDADPDAAERDAVPPPTLDERLSEVLDELEVPVAPLEPPVVSDALYELGQALFFDPLLSGNKDVACASCHHPDFAMGDGMPLALGTGASGLGPERAVGAHRGFVPRHAPELSNRGDPGWRRLFWDGRVELRDGALRGPVPLPDGLSGVLAAQALFPLLTPVEMLGQPGDTAADGEPNELAALPLDDPESVWDGVVARVVELPAYEAALAEAFPELAGQRPDITHLANALAAFQARAFAFTDTPWDRYLRGELDAMTPAQKLGAAFFFGGTGCGRCHTGPLLTDQQFHNVGVPQVGPGQPDTAPYDHGREQVTGREGDRFAFRTAPLRNVALTAPYMHDGAFADLAAVMAHYARPDATARNFVADRLPDYLRDQVHLDPEHVEALVAGISEDAQVTGNTAIGLANVTQFLHALTDPAAEDLSGLVPDSVPSGLGLP